MTARDDSSEGRVGETLDLLVVVALACAVVTVSFGLESPPRSLALAAAAVAVFLPGFALVAALFPRRPSADTARRFAERVRRPDAFERFVLAFATGAVVTPLLGIALNFSPWLVRTRALHTTVLGFVVLATVVAAVRRQRLPAAERYRPASRWRRALVGLVDGHRGREFDLVTVAVAVAVVVAVGGVVTVAGTAQTGESFTEFAVLSDDGDRLVAGDYPENVTAGDPVTVDLEIENREGEAATYTVVTKLQRLAPDDDDTRVATVEAFDRVSLRLESGRVERVDHTVRPTLTGERLRLVFMLYRGDPPERPVTTNAYRHTHVWLNVSEPTGTEPAR